MRPPGAASPSAKSIPEDEIPLAVMAGRMKKFSENTSTITEVMYCSTIKFNPNFVLRFFFGGGALCASKPWSICSVCKNFRAHHTMPKIVYRNKSIRV